MSFPVTECVFPVTWIEDLYCYHLSTFYFAPLVLCSREQLLLHYCIFHEYVIPVTVIPVTVWFVTGKTQIVTGKTGDAVLCLKLVKIDSTLIWYQYASEY
jgi:hypothetical protein